MNNNDSATILTQVLEEMKREQGDSFSLDKVNLAELGRRTGISRKKLRRLKKNGFNEKPHGLVGKKAEVTVLTGFTGVIDDLLRKGVYNSAVIQERLEGAGRGRDLSDKGIYACAQSSPSRQTADCKSAGKPGKALFHRSG